MKKYKGIIFDLDGTLLDTIFDLGDSVNEALEMFGYPPHTYEEYKLKIGGGFRKLIWNSLPETHREDDVIEAVLKIFVEAYDRKFKDKTVPYEGIMKLVEQIQKEGIPMGINSNKRTDYTNALVDKFFANTKFVEVYGEREGIPRKPDPAGALEICHLMKLNPSEVLYVGDSNTDMKTGANAGMDTIGVVWGFRGRDELERYQGTYVVDDPQEIYDILQMEL